jgi:hypothetical protein
MYYVEEWIVAISLVGGVLFGLAAALASVRRVHLAVSAAVLFLVLGYEIRMDRWEKTVRAPIRLDMFVEIPLTILFLMFGTWQIFLCTKRKNFSSGEVDVKGGVAWLPFSCRYRVQWSEAKMERPALFCGPPQADILCEYRGHWKICVLGVCKTKRPPLVRRGDSLRSREMASVYSERDAEASPRLAVEDHVIGEAES